MLNAEKRDTTSISTSKAGLAGLDRPILFQGVWARRPRSLMSALLHPKSSISISHPQSPITDLPSSLLTSHSALGTFFFLFPNN
jgi:hypothetical protein